MGMTHWKIGCGAAAVAGLILLSACGPKEGSKEWCQQKMNAPPGQLSPSDSQKVFQKCDISSEH